MGHAHGLALSSALGNRNVQRVLAGPASARSGRTGAQALGESVARARQPAQEDTGVEAGPGGEIRRERTGVRRAVVTSAVQRRQAADSASDWSPRKARRVLDLIEQDYEERLKPHLEDKAQGEAHAHVRYAKQYARDHNEVFAEAVELVQEISEAGMRAITGDMGQVVASAAASFVAGNIPKVGLIVGPLADLAVGWHQLSEQQAKAERTIARTASGFTFLLQLQQHASDALIDAVLEESSDLAQLRRHEQAVAMIFDPDAEERSESRLERNRRRLRGTVTATDITDVQELLAQHSHHHLEITALTGRIERMLVRSRARWDRFVPEFRRAFVARVAEEGTEVIGPPTHPQAGRRTAPQILIWAQAYAHPLHAPDSLRLRSRGRIEVGKVDLDDLAPSMGELVRGTALGEMRRRFGLAHLIVTLGPVPTVGEQVHLIWNRSSGVKQHYEDWERVFALLNGRRPDDGDRGTLTSQLYDIGGGLADKTPADLEGSLTVPLPGSP